MKTIAAIILYLVTSIAAVHAWTAPIGIPTPNWGATIANPIEMARPTPPSPWTSNVANVYYVETGGSNSGEGYPGNPRNAMPLILPAGSVVFINGTYTQSHDPYYIKHNGSASAPCWILNYNEAQRVQATAGWVFLDTAENPCNYVIVDGINWNFSTNGGNVTINGGCDHICLRNSSIVGVGRVFGEANYTSSENAYNGTTILIQSSGSMTVNPTSHIVIDNVDVTRSGNWLYVEGVIGDPDAHCIGVAFPTKDIWVTNCEFSYASGCAIQVGTGSTGSTPDASGVDRCYVGNCLAHHIAQTAIFSKRSQDCIFSQNVAHTIRRDCPSSPNSGGFGTQYGARNLWIIYNTVYNCQAGITYAGAADSPQTNTDLYAIGNVLYNIRDEQAPFPDSSRTDNNGPGGGTAILVRGGLNVNIINNTLYDYDAGVLCAYGGRTMRVEGNMFTNHNTSVGYADIFLAEPTTNVIHNNVFSGTPWVRTGDAVFDTFAEVTAEFGGANSNTTPSFVNAASGNFRLNTGSSGIDGFNTTAHAVYDTFQTMYGRSIKYDITGGSRPYNTTWDIGAYEFGSSVPPVVPAPTYSIEFHVTPSAPE